VLIEDGNTAREFYDPSMNVWQATLNQPNVSDPLAVNVALYDPSTNEWTPAAASPVGAETLTPLLNVQELVTESKSAALLTPWGEQGGAAKTLLSNQCLPNLSCLPFNLKIR
jgi:hypothetical protein